jgi:hypothetical protein
MRTQIIRIVIALGTIVLLLPSTEKAQTIPDAIVLGLLSQFSNVDSTARMHGFYALLGLGAGASPSTLRSQLFKSLKEAALFQPVRVLRLIRRALENEAITVQVWSDWAVTQKHVLREIPPLLRAISLHLDHIEEVAEILCALGQERHSRS